MTRVTLKYTVILTGDDTIEVPNDSADAARDAIRIARSTRPFLATAQFEVVEVATDATESDEASV